MAHFERSSKAWKVVWKMVYAQTRIYPVVRDSQNSLRFWNINGPPNSARKVDLVLVKKNKRTGQLVELTTPADHRMKVKKGKKSINNRELKKLWNMLVTMIKIIDRSFNWQEARGNRKVRKNWERPKHSTV